MESVFPATFIGLSYSTVHGTITVYEYNTYRHTDTCILSACFISQGAIFSRSGPHGRGDCMAPFSAPCASLNFFLKRTTTITQAGSVSQTFDPELSLLTFSCAIDVAYIFASVKAITVKFLVWKNTTGKEYHHLELTSNVTTEFAYNSTSRGLHKKRYC